MAVRTNESHIGQSVIFSIPVLVVKAENFRMLVVSAPLAPVDRYPATLVGSLESVGRCSYRSGHSSAYLTTKPSSVGLTSGYFKILATLLTGNSFLRLKASVSHFSSAFGRAVSSRLSRSRQNRKFLVAVQAIPLVFDAREIEQCVALPGTEVSCISPSRVHIENFCTVFAGFVLSCSNFVFAALGSSHLMIINQYTYRCNHA